MEELCNQTKDSMVPARVPIQASTTLSGGLVPRDLDQLWRMATWIQKSGMAPKDMKSAEAVAVAIQMGLEVGLAPMQAVQNIAVINGRPSIWGDAALALVRASGELERFKEWMTGTPRTDDWTAHCLVKRKGDEDVQEESFSLADAKQAKLFPADPLTPWHKYTQRMLKMRARSWALRDKFTDILKGLQMREEAADVVELTATGNGTYAVEEKTQDRLEQLKAQIAQAAPAKTVTDIEQALIDSFWGLKTPGFKAWLNEHGGQIDNPAAGFTSLVKDRLEQKCKAIFGCPLSEVKDMVWLKVPDEAPEQDSPAMHPVMQQAVKDMARAIDPLVDCPMSKGERRYGSYCDTVCPDRKGCPSWPEADEDEDDRAPYDL